MKLEQQVTSLEISKRLKELGVRQESLFYWRLGYSTSESFKNGVSTGKQGHFRDYELTYYPKPRYTTADIKWNERDLARLDETELSAFTVAELGEMLSSKGGVYFSGKDNLESPNKWFCTKMSMPEFEYWQEQFVQADTEADARGKMLIYLLENKLLAN